MSGPEAGELERYLRRSIELAAANARVGERPYAAVIVRNGEVLGEGVNAVLSSGDPTAHAEVQAVRGTCAKHGVRTLAGAWAAVNCRPCEMCEAAMRLVGISQVFIAGECLSGPPLVRPAVAVTKMATEGAAQPFDTFRQTGLTFVDDPAAGV